MSIGAVPPDEVLRLRSMENRRVVTAARGKASCMAARHSQCTLQSNPSSSPALASAQLPVHTAPSWRPWRDCTCSQCRCSRVTLCWMSTPPQTITASSAGAFSRLASGVICRPSLALTGLPSWLRVYQRYSSLPESWLAMRSGSTAEAREIRVKLSSSRKPMVWGTRFCGWEPVVDCDICETLTLKHALNLHCEVLFLLVLVRD